MRLNRFVIAVGGLLCILGQSCGGGSGGETRRLIEVARTGSSIKVRQEACAELGRRGDTSATGALVEMLDDAALEWTAARSLGQLKATSAESALVEHLWTHQGQLNRDAVWALGELRAQGAKAALNKTMKYERESYAMDSTAIDSALIRIEAGGERQR